MANHKSAVKAHKQSLNNRVRNQSVVSRIKTFIKKLEEVLVPGKAAEAREAFRVAESEIMKGASKGVFKKNAAARKVSRLVKRVKALEAN
ncbi:MAG: ribosomal protein S20p [Candidatus Midichloriaceae bacterium]|jgi:small subunit ribosomal protein S20|nr:ribosomal protein S20p [Candidatus Midichloriaceae bacterium]